MVTRRGFDSKARPALVRRAVALLAALLLSAAAASAVQSPDGRKDPLAFAAIGDTGIGEKPQFDVARQMKIYRDKVRFDFVLMLGDNIYPDGRAAFFKQRFEEPYDELLKSDVKFYAVLGNHDVINGTQAQTNYDKFNMEGRRYYSFTKGDGLVEFFALDSNVMTEQQLFWLEDALKSSKARWKVAFMHHPIYSSGRNRGSDLNLRRLLEPLFIGHKVDVVFTGHSHIYERTKPQNGVHYFTSGAGGKIRKGDIDRKSPFLEFGNDEINSFVVVQVTETQMKVEAIAADGAILDSTSIEKNK